MASQDRERKLPGIMESDGGLPQHQTYHLTTTSYRSTGRKYTSTSRKYTPTSPSYTSSTVRSSSSNNRRQMWKINERQKINQNRKSNSSSRRPSTQRLARREFSQPTSRAESSFDSLKRRITLLDKTPSKVQRIHQQHHGGISSNREKASKPASVEASERTRVNVNSNRKDDFLTNTQSSKRKEETKYSLSHRQSRNSTVRKRQSTHGKNEQQRLSKTADMSSAKRPRYETDTKPVYQDRYRRNKPIQSGMRNESSGALAKQEPRKGKTESRRHKDISNRYNLQREVKRSEKKTDDKTCQQIKEYKPISYSALENICRINDKNEAMLEIIKMEERYVSLLNSKDEIREDLLKLVIDSLVVVLKSTNRKTQVICILGKTHQQLLRFHLQDFILKLPDSKVADEKDLENLITKLIDIFEAMLQRMASMVVYDLPLSHLNDVVERFHEEGHIKDDIKERLKKTNALWKVVRKRTSNKGHNGEYVEPPNDFREMSVIPNYMDFKPGAKPFLRANVIDSAYNDVQHYLDVQFRLLREDFIIPLRDGVKQLRRERNMLENRHQLQENKKKPQGLVYRDVKIINPLCNRDGGVYRIQFNARHPTLKRLRWEKSKRLKFGALVCLSPDFFDTLYFGAVENRSPENLSYGELELRFENCNGQLMRGFIESKTEFQMVESDSYFEAYKHNLTALQQLNGENLPFKEHIVYCDKEIKPPKYLVPEPIEKEEQALTDESVNEDDILNESSSKDKVNDTNSNLAKSAGALVQQNKYMKLESIADLADPVFLQEHKLDELRVPVLDLNQWPCKEALGLDESQYHACQLALTNRFALIQGPPGTGKTYVGLKIADALLDNSELWNGESKSPILMVSFTNHALDQFLMGLTSREGIVRVGGRSKEKELEANNLKMLRRNHISPSTIERGRIWKRIKLIEEKFCPKEASLLIGESNKAILSVEILREFLEKTHLESFVNRSIDQDKSLNTVLIEWLRVEVKAQTTRNANDFSNNDNFQMMFSHREFMDDEEDAVEDVCHHKQIPITACHLNEAVKPEELRRNLGNQEIMSEWEERGIDNIFRASLTQRWRLYRLWCDRLQRNCQQKIKDTQDALYETELRRLHDIDKEKDLEILRSARVVGMTTTSAAKYCDLLQRVKPKIVIVEEAAEVLEAHILTSLPLDCEHVILIGDHQQLRPSCTVYELAKKYNLNISMFERLVKLGMPCVRLSEQHRMRPEIASLMKHIYKDLHNHTSVNEYEDVHGFQHNVFFIDHRYPEGESEDSHSHFNEHEAKFLVKLYRYIIQQGYKPSQVTILTPYLGQMFTIRDHLTSEAQSDLREIRLTTIDNYQGEENDIILLSLVRSNDTGHVGFVSDINRACVALSRARMGLYVIGNFELLSEKSDIWKKVVRDLKGKDQIGEALPLRCQSHKDKILVKNPEDFMEMVPCGGCRLPCEYRLDCGHACTLPCHPYDQDHKNFSCVEQCTKKIPGCDHPCQKLCWQKCESKCYVRVNKTLPCQHIKNAQCSDSPRNIKCDERCPKYLSCGHQCQARCGEPCTSACMELVKHNDWPCGHNVTIACSATPLDCRGPCGRLSCGHECSGKCGECLLGRVHRRCKKICGRVLVCGHHCRASCTVTCPPCGRKCETTCQHSKCPKNCGELCVPCKHRCEWNCEHFKCNMRCGEVCDRPRCNEPCRKKVKKCGHKCRGLCEESCICVTCQKDDIQEMFGTEDLDDETVRFIQLRDCKHIFEVSGLDRWVDMVDDEEKTVIQMKACPLCKTLIRNTMRYNAVIKKKLEDIEKVKEVILGDRQTLHQRRDVLKPKLDHYVRELGTQIESKHLRKCEILQKQIQRSRNNFELTNLENQVKLLERCLKVIQKSKITKSKNPVERSANETEITSIVCTLNYLKTERIVGCDVERELVDIDLEISRQSLHLEVCCLLKDTKALNIDLRPEDQEQVVDISNKLSRISKIEEPELESCVKKIEEIRSKYPINPLTREEKDKIVKAMGLAKGHWYKCRQGHIYAIGECGGAMERGTCPECKEAIGGASHRLEEGNEVATEMDGARYSAWSEQANMANYDL